MKEDQDASVIEENGTPINERIVRIGNINKPFKSENYFLNT